MSDPKPMPYNIRVNESMTEYAFRMLEERDELQVENERLKEGAIEFVQQSCRDLRMISQINKENKRLKDELSSVEAAYRARLEQYESTPKRALKAVMGFHGIVFNFGRESDKYGWLGLYAGKFEDSKNLAFKTVEYQGQITAEDMEG